MNTKRWVSLVVPLCSLLLLVPFGVLADDDDDALKVLVRGATLHGSNGMYFDAQDRLHVASVWGREIAVVNPKNGELLDRIGPDRGVEGPDDLFVCADGTIYQTSIVTGHVIRISPDGTVKRQFVAPGVNPITFSDDGRLFVALDFFGDGLFEIDPELNAPPRSIIAGNLGWMNGMDWGPDGRLYGPVMLRGVVASLDVDSCNASSDPWKECDLRVVTSGGVSAVKFDSTGSLYAVEGEGRVWRIDPVSGVKWLVSEVRGSLDNLAFDSSDNLYVSNFDDGFVWHIKPNGKAKTILDGGPIAPGGIAVVPRSDGKGGVKESIFVADIWRLREFAGVVRPGTRRIRRGARLPIHRLHGRGEAHPQRVGKQPGHLSSIWRRWRPSRPIGASPSRSTRFRSRVTRSSPSSAGAASCAGAITWR